MNAGVERLSESYVRAHRSPSERRFGILYEPLKAVQRAFGRVTGEYSVEDCLRMLVRCYPGCLISGNVSIGNRVIVAGHAVVDKDVPDDSIVYNVNEVRPLKDHHKRYLRTLLWLCMHEYRLVPGLVYRRGELYVDHAYAATRAEMYESLR
jgi:hypothetical protein